MKTPHLAAAFLRLDLAPQLLGFGDTMMMTPTGNVENRRDEAYLAHSYYSGCQCMDRKQSDVGRRDGRD